MVLIWYLIRYRWYLIGTYSFSYDMLNLSMSIKKDFEEADKQFNDYLYPNGKGKSPVKTYDVEPFGDKEWGMFKSDIWAKGRFGTMLINKFKIHYDDGWYPSKEEFLETVNTLFDNLFKYHDALESQSVTDNEVFDDLFEEYNDILNQRTMDYGVADKLLRDKAKEIQKKIEMYLAKKVKAGETLTDEMLGFKGVDALKDAMHFEKILKPQLPKPPTPEQIKKAQEKPPSKSKPPTPLSGEDFDSNWECAMYVRKRIVTGDGFSKDTEIFTGYDWAVEHCTVKGKPIEHRNKLINGYDNAKRKTKSAVIIGKFEEDYYD